MSKDGQVKIRILNQDGAFVKNATVTPKKIAIFDQFALPSESEKLNGKIEHGDMVKAFAQRNNPYADYTFINLDGRDDWFDFDDSHSEKVMTIFEQSGIKNKHLDYLSISLGRDVSVFSEKTFEEQKHVASREPKNHFIYFLKEMADKKKRVLISSGNEGKGYVSLYLNGQCEGVGALSEDGKIAEYSASRNSGFTQHYELGDYEEKFIYNSDGQIIGKNITGLPGCDFQFKYKELSNEDLNAIEELKQQLKVAEHELEKAKNKYKYKFWKYKYLKQLKKNVSDISSKINILIQRTKLEKVNTTEKIAEGFYIEKDWLLNGTSFSTPVRVAKLALNDMMKDII